MNCNITMGFKIDFTLLSLVTMRKNISNILAVHRVLKLFLKTNIEGHFIPKSRYLLITNLLHIINILVFFSVLLNYSVLKSWINKLKKNHNGKLDLLDFLHHRCTYEIGLN